MHARGMFRPVDSVTVAYAKMGLVIPPPAKDKI